MDKSRRDLALALLLAAAVGAVEIALHARISRPLWYDELWRPHFAGEPWATFWPELRSANTPSSLGSIALTRTTGDVLGWHAWSLRLTGAALWLPVLAATTYLAARRFTAAVTAAGAALAVALSATVVDSGTQLKPYVLEAVVSLAVVALWTAPGTPLRNRSAAGALALVSTPAVFLLVPLALGDLVRRRRAAWQAAPALLLAGAHAALFVTHQSSQRASRFWDRQFLAGRGVLGGLRFTADQARAILGGAPPGIDRYDPNLAHSLTEGHRSLTVVLGIATTIAVIIGARTLARRPDGVTLLIALGGAELVILAASGARYWPFGACRTNLFLVPLLTIVAATGAGEIAAAVRRRCGAWSARGAVAGAAGGLCLVGLVATPVSAAGGLGPLWRQRHEVRPIENMVAATAVARGWYRPGDAVVVGGRLARAGWLYGTELSDGTGAANRPRIPRSATTFLVVIGRGDAARAVSARRQQPRAVLLFVLAYDRRGTSAELSALRRIGWCPRGTRAFQLTGTLYDLGRCTDAPKPATPTLVPADARARR